MTDEENIILEYLKTQPDCAFARREIARRAVRRSVYEENPRWVDAPLASLVDQKLIQADKNGHYHVPWEELFSEDEAAST